MKQTARQKAFDFSPFFKVRMPPKKAEVTPLWAQPPPDNTDEEGNKNWSATIPEMIVGMQDSNVNLRRCKAVPVFFAGKPSDRQVILADCITLGAGVVFGAVDCVAWSFVFPSLIEQFIWRVSSTTITAVPVFLILTFLVAYSIHKNMVFSFLIFFMVFCGVLYTAARFTMLVLAFMQLASLPSGAFQAVQWTLFIPHI
jgi:hypothetical protein